MSAPLTMTLAEVAVALRGEPRRAACDWFYRHWPALVAEHGFPAPLPGLGKRWSRDQVVRWCNRATDDVRIAVDADATIMEGLAAELRDRARALGGAAAGRP